MALNLWQIEVIGGGFGADYSSVAAPVMRRSVNCSRKSTSSFFFARSNLHCRASSAVDKIKGQGDLELEVEEQDYSGTPYVPVYVMLSHVIDPKFGLHDETYLREELSRLKSMNVDGVKVQCWWGIIEPQVPKYYDWSDYKALFQIVRDFKLKLQVVLCFHAYPGWCCLPELPQWVIYVGKKNPDIFFTNSDGRRNHECLSWGIDDEPVLMNRTASEVYRDFMISFREELKEFLADGFISKIEIGLGPCGELRIPSRIDDSGPRYGQGPPLPVKQFQGEFPPIEEFQFYDKYMMKSLKDAWEERGDSLCGVRRPSTGSSNSRPRGNASYQEPIGSMSFYGRFFLKWYSRVLVDHADKMLSVAYDTFLDYCSISAKIPEICHLWYESNVDFGNCSRHTKSSAPIISVLRKYKTSLNCTVPELRALGHSKDVVEALADEIGMDWQLLYAAWAAGIQVSAETDDSFDYRRDCQEILEIAKSTNDPIGRHLSSFTYLGSVPRLQEFERFVEKMHGQTN